MSAAPALTPFRTTPQNPSWAWPWVTISILMSERLTSAPSRPPPPAVVPDPAGAGLATLVQPAATIASPARLTRILRNFIPLISSKRLAAGAAPSRRLSGLSVSRRVERSLMEAATGHLLSLRAILRPRASPVKGNSAAMPSCPHSRADLLEADDSVLLERRGR